MIRNTSITCRFQRQSALQSAAANLKVSDDLELSEISSSIYIPRGPSAMWP